MDLRESTAVPAMLGVLVLIDNDKGQRAESRAFMAPMDPSQRERAASELRRMADELTNGSCGRLMTHGSQPAVRGGAS